MKRKITEKPVKLCSECAELKPLTSFRRRYRDRPQRVTVCNFCHVRRERLRRRKKRQQKDQLVIQKFATAYCSTRDQQRRRRIFQLGIKAVGGFDSFLKKWVAAIHDLVNRGQSSPRLLRLFELLWELQREQDMQRRATLDNTSDADLKNLVDMQLKKLIEQDPELVLSAAQRLGWGLIPPNGSNPGDQAVLAS